MISNICLRRFNIVFSCAVLSGVILFCMHVVRTPASIIAFFALYGAASGGLITLQSACIAQITENVGLVGVKIGVMMTVSSFGVLTGSPIGGAFVSESHGGFGGFIDFSAVVILAGAAFLLVSRYLVDRNMWKAV
jgi:MFS family permease